MRPNTSLRRHAALPIPSHAGRWPRARVSLGGLLCWLLVLAPLAWGVYQTLREVEPFLR